MQFAVIDCSRYGELILQRSPRPNLLIATFRRTCRVKSLLGHCLSFPGPRGRIARGCSAYEFAVKMPILEVGIIKEEDLLTCAVWHGCLSVLDGPRGTSNIISIAGDDPSTIAGRLTSSRQCHHNRISRPSLGRALLVARRKLATVPNSVGGIASPASRPHRLATQASNAPAIPPGDRTRRTAPAEFRFESANGLVFQQVGSTPPKPASRVSAAGH